MFSVPLAYSPALWDGLIALVEMVEADVMSRKLKPKPSGVDVRWWE